MSSSTTSSSKSSSTVGGKPPVTIDASDRHTATMFFFHGLGDQGDGWASIFRQEMRIEYFKYVVPNAASRAVTLNFGMHMPAWYDLYGLSADSREDEAGIEAAKKYVHGLIDEEVAKGTPSERIVIGGFSMGGALALYAGLTYDKPLSCLVSFSGFLLQRNKLPAACTVNAKIPIFLGHGKNDFIVPVTFGEMTEKALKVFNPNAQLRKYDTDHSTTKQEQDDALAFTRKHVPKK